MIEYIFGASKFIERIEPMWNKQRIYHSECSRYFSDIFVSLTYDKRKQVFYEYGDNIFIIIACENGNDIGYCVASITEDKGEIDSIYVNENYRKHKVGTALMNKALQWLDENHITNIELSVAVGNEGVHHFYKQFGFYPRATKLVRK